VWTVQHLLPGEVINPVTRTAVLKVSAEESSLLVDATWHPTRAR
jgi:hypothetical protein